jgi:predicted SprT family Zn-dependent metalloprotease
MVQQVAGGRSSRPKRVKTSMKKVTMACKRCGHDMGRSRARTIQRGDETFFGTTCGKCRQLHQIFFRLASIEKVTP